MPYRSQQVRTLWHQVSISILVPYLVADEVAFRQDVLIRRILDQIATDFNYAVYDPIYRRVREIKTLLDGRLILSEADIARATTPKFSQSSSSRVDPRAADLNQLIQEWQNFYTGVYNKVPAIG